MFHRSVMGCVLIGVLWVVFSYESYGLCFHRSVMGCVS